MNIPITKKLDVDINLWYDLWEWSLPLSVVIYAGMMYDWNLSKGEVEYLESEAPDGWNFSISLRLLCFGFRVELWRWFNR